MGRGASGTNPYNTTNKGKVIAVTGTGRRMTAKGMATVKGSAMSIKDMKNRDMQKEVQQAISRYASKMGLRETDIKLADMRDAWGVTFIGSDGSQGIYLNKKLFDRPKKEFVADYKENYKRRGGFKNVTRKPAQHTVTHELAHATWCSNYTGAKQKAAGKEIKALYKAFIKDKSKTRKKNYGSYGNSNVDEFWAEVITKGIHGDNDRYTRRAFAIAKKYKL